MVSILLEAHSGAARACNTFGQLPLHLAAANKAQLSGTRILLDAYPGGTNVADHQGQLPIDVACADRTKLFEYRPVWDILQGIMDGTAARSELDEAVAPVKQLNLAGQEVTGAKCLILCESLGRANTSLTHLDLEHNPLGTSGCLALATFISVPTSRLSMVKVGGGDGFGLTDETVRDRQGELFQVLHSKKLEQLKDIAEKNQMKVSQGDQKADLIQRLVNESTVFPKDMAGPRAIAAAMKAKPGFTIELWEEQEMPTPRKFQNLRPLVIQGHFAR